MSLGVFLKISKITFIRNYIFNIIFENIKKVKIFCYTSKHFFKTQDEAYLTL